MMEQLVMTLAGVVAPDFLVMDLFPLRRRFLASAYIAGRSSDIEKCSLLLLLRSHHHPHPAPLSSDFERRPRRRFEIRGRAENDESTRAIC